MVKKLLTGLTNWTMAYKTVVECKSQELCWVIEKFGIHSMLTSWAQESPSHKETQAYKLFQSVYSIYVLLYMSIKKGYSNTAKCQDLR